MYGYQQYYQGYTPLQQMPQRQPVLLNGRWGFVKSYQDIEAAQVPADGTQTIFMLENEPTFYIVGFQNGQKMINGFSFTALNAGTIKHEETGIEARLAKIEAFLKDLNGGDLSVKSDSGSK